MTSSSPLPLGPMAASATSKYTFLRIRVAGLHAHRYHQQTCQAVCPHRAAYSCTVVARAVARIRRSRALWCAAQATGLAAVAASVQAWVALLWQRQTRSAVGERSDRGRWVVVVVVVVVVVMLAGGEGIPEGDVDASADCILAGGCDGDEAVVVVCAGVFGAWRAKMSEADVAAVRRAIGPVKSDSEFMLFV